MGKYGKITRTDCTKGEGRESWSEKKTRRRKIHHLCKWKILIINFIKHLLPITCTMHVFVYTQFAVHTVRVQRTMCIAHRVQYFVYCVCASFVCHKFLDIVCDCYTVIFLFPRSLLDFFFFASDCFAFRVDTAAGWCNTRDCARTSFCRVFFLVLSVYWSNAHTINSFKISTYNFQFSCELSINIWIEQRPRRGGEGEKKNILHSFPGAYRTRVQTFYCF